MSAKNKADAASAKRVDRGLERRFVPQIGNDHGSAPFAEE